MQSNPGFPAVPLSDVMALTSARLAEDVCPPLCPSPQTLFLPSSQQSPTSLTTLIHQLSVSQPAPYCLRAQHQGSSNQSITSVFGHWPVPSLP